MITGCESGPHEKRLLHALLDNYNVLERPVVNESDPLQLSFGLTLMQIIDVVSIACAHSHLMIFSSIDCLRQSVSRLIFPTHICNWQLFGSMQCM